MAAAHIRTSFTAAHPRSSWSRYPHKDKDIQTQPQHLHQYNLPGISINSHNQYLYNHHLYASHSGFPPYPASAAQGPGCNHDKRKGTVGGSAATAGGRRCLVSIRMPPAYAAPYRGRSQMYKFDPFADDEALILGASASAALSVTTPLTASTQVNRVPLESEESLQQHSAPYTIHIPAAQPTEIQQFTPHPAPGPSARSATLRSMMPINGPLLGTTPIATSGSERTSPHNQQTPNLSKIVAGILLNRVHAVGKPMRRRLLPHLNGEGGKGYRKSCLSSVISVEA